MPIREAGLRYTPVAPCNHKTYKRTKKGNGMKLLVTLGIQSRTKTYDPEQKTAIGGIALVDWETKQITQFTEYRSPQSICCPTEIVRMGFGSFKDNWYYTCMPTEIVRFSLPDLRCETVLTHPTFSDLHHVAALDDRLLVCNTGLEIMQTFDYQGNLLETFNAASTPTWERFSRETDYRLLPTTKPHERHINYVFLYEGKTWLTRFHQKDAICLSNPNDTMPVESGNPHDGIVLGDKIYFTTTNGHIVIVDAPNRRIAKDINLINVKHALGEVQLGWCRGLDVKDGYAYVGFSRLRKTKWREFASWVKHAKGPRYPARIEKIDIDKEELVDEIKLEPMATVVFGISILPDHLQGV